ncbi:GLUG [Syntrophomonas zehnderi OL-4]|uniref:GLUG n=1 Tax=Syntrophomonas zehnderi OL-4 TaxID=690567 RepID=A0A0E3W314_9FIRM|nr:GLUG motif-containing protein [Syntrophomonas zehnderi]CFX39799.1 GLUG [Syntrophomonas zehnderi OL-4]
MWKGEAIPKDAIKRQVYFPRLVSITYPTFFSPGFFFPSDKFGNRRGDAIINAADTEHAGVLAGSNDGTIENCLVENAVINGKTNVGGLVGTNTGNISFVAVSGNIMGKSQVGGIVGQMTNGTLDRAAAAATVTAQNETSAESRVGGVIGYLKRGEISNSFSLGGPITGASSTGGFVGEVDQNAAIITSYTASRPYGVEEAANRGAFVGLDKGGNYSNCYYISSFVERGRTGVTNIEYDEKNRANLVEPNGVNNVRKNSSMDIKNRDSYEGFDFDKIWTIESEYASGYPVISGMSAHGTCVENPIEINTLEQLKAIPHVSALHYKLMDSFDLTDADWSPIYYFVGNFNGNGKTLSNITVQDGIRGGAFSLITSGRITDLIVDGAQLEKPSDFGDRSLSGIGVFGSLYYSSAENCIVKNITSYGRQCTAAMFGISEVSKIKNCHVLDSKVYGVYKEDPNYIAHPIAIGGLVGQVFDNNEIKGCSVTNTEIICDIYQDGRKKADEIGGLIGSIYLASTVENCHVYGGQVKGNVAVGGFLGGAAGNGPTMISNCSSSASVEGFSNTGGFVGVSGGTKNTYNIKYTNCFATGDATAQYIVGGFTGLASGGAYISNCYATGNVEGTGYWPNNGTSAAGGFVGEAYIAASVTDCYATGNVVARKGGGGFVGSNANISCMIESEKEPMIKRCYATGNVMATDLFGDSKSGGFVGHNGFDSSTIMDCYATGDVSGFQYVGGFAGEMDSANAINCYTTSKVSTSIEGTAGGFAGIARRSYYSPIRFLNCIFDKDTAGVDIAIAKIDSNVKLPKNSEFAWPDPNWPVDNIKAFTSEQMNNKALYKTEGPYQYKSPITKEIVTIPVEWDFERVWAMEDEASPPYLQALGNVHLISLNANKKVIDIDETAVITLTGHDLAAKVTWEVTGTGSIESETNNSVTIKATDNGVITVSVLIDGIKKKDIEIVAGTGGEQGISAIFVTPAPLADGMAYNIDTKPTLIIKFTEPIDVISFNKLTDPVKLTGFANKKIDVTTSFSQNNTLLTIKPKDKLLDGTEHIISVAKEVKGTSGKNLKGITAMSFLTNSFDVPIVSVMKDGKKASELKAGQTYNLNAEFINNIPNFEEHDIYETANIYIVVRHGMGARATYGGDILTSVEKPLSLLNKDGAVAAVGSVSTEFTLPDDAAGILYVDIYTWDKEKKFAKALPTHITYQIEK